MFCKIDLVFISFKTIFLFHILSKIGVFISSKLIIYLSYILLELKILVLFFFMSEFKVYMTRFKKYGHELG